MKHFNVTIHPKLEDTNLSASDIHHGRWTERTLGMAKRLTGAELAAEYWRAFYEFKMAHDMADLIPGPDTWSDLHRDTGWMYAMERFATLPHYDDVIA